MPWRFLVVLSILLSASSLPPGLAAEASGHTLVFQRSKGALPSGHRRWVLQVRRAGQTLASWTAVSGTRQAQGSDRRWSPGNGAPLPVGTYNVGRPERWAGSWWIDLNPRFSTTRSALGIHTCLPGSGCICLPSRADTEAVARWINKTGLSQLQVLN